MTRAHSHLLWRYGPLSLLLALGACTPPPPPPSEEPGLVAPTQDGPADAAEGTCWGKTVTPAVIERVRERIELSPAEINPDGTIAKPPEYRIEERQVIVSPRQNAWFETPCPDVLTPEFVATLQRALQARGAYTGPISGVLDDATSASIKTYQSQSGLDSPVLALSTARELGLIAIPRPPSPEPS